MKINIFYRQTMLWAFVLGLSASYSARGQSLAEVIGQVHEHFASPAQWQKVQSYVEVSNENWEGKTVEATLYAKRPLQMKRVVRYEGSEYVFCYNGNRDGWKIDPTISPNALPMDKKDLKESYRYFTALEVLFNEKLLAFSSLTGKTKFLGVDCYEIKTPEGDGNYFYTYIRADTFYPQAVKMSNGNKKHDMVRLFKAFQQFDGLSIPVKSEYYLGGELVGLTQTTDFRVNHDISPSVFVSEAKPNNN